MNEPLSSLLRPTTLDECIGQQDIIGENKPIRVFLEQKNIPSMMFRWPPWCGKTTVARVIANTLEAETFFLSGVTSKKEDLKQILAQAKINRQYGKNTIIFLDEIHRRNKAQQDTLLPYVEKGDIILIWATTENPSFSINSALLSRTRTFVFERLSEHDIQEFITKNKEKILSTYPEITLNEDIIAIISRQGNGDLRTSLNILESAIVLKKTWTINEEDIKVAGQKNLYFDKNGEEHYNIISAIHKCLRDSDADAACYWIQRMLAGGEDPLYIARRLLRFASEDIGPADNNALLLANQVYNAVAKVGMPESDIFLIQLALYLAKAPKNNITYKISLATKADIEKYGNLPVPMDLRNAPTKFMAELWYGKNYQYAHDQADKKTTNQHFPDELKNRKYTK
jgi:putative ATPase